MEEAPENGKESSHSAHANGMKEWMDGITNNCAWHTCVTWQGTNYELPEDDTVVSKHVGGVW
jgi:hypothetical protein